MRLSLLFVGLVLCGCSSMSWEERHDREEQAHNAAVLKLHPLGTARSEELARFTATNSIFDGRLLSMVVRPESGWPETKAYKFQENFFALRHESKSGTTVQSCAVIELPRFSGPKWIPNPSPGIWFDYLFFDASDRLIWAHRRFVD